MDGLNRHIVKKINRLLDSFPVVVITGACQFDLIRISYNAINRMDVEFYRQYKTSVDCKERVCSSSFGWYY